MGHKQDGLSASLIKSAGIPTHGILGKGYWRWQGRTFLMPFLRTGLCPFTLSTPFWCPLIGGRGTTLLVPFTGLAWLAETEAISQKWGGQNEGKQRKFQSNPHDREAWARMNMAKLDTQHKDTATECARGTRRRGFIAADAPGRWRS